MRRRERPAEGGDRPVADRVCHLRHGLAEIAQPLARLPHPHVAEHLHRAAAGDPPEPAGQRGARQVRGRRHPVQRPRLARPRDQGRHHRCDLLVGARDVLVGWPVLEPGRGHRSSDETRVAGDEQPRVAGADHRTGDDQPADAAVPVAERRHHQWARQRVGRHDQPQVGHDDDRRLGGDQPVRRPPVDEDGVSGVQRLPPAGGFQRAAAVPDQRPQRTGGVGEDLVGGQTDPPHGRHLPPGGDARGIGGRGRLRAREECGHTDRSLSPRPGYSPAHLGPGHLRSATWSGAPPRRATVAAYWAMSTKRL